jgi:hypothetical protein
MDRPSNSAVRAAVERQQHLRAIAAIRQVAEASILTDVCPQGCGEQQVVEQGSNPGFTGAPIHWWRLACGHSDMDTSADNLEAAR